MKTNCKLFFTLIELLVVIAMIAILAAMLLPTAMWGISKVPSFGQKEDLISVFSGNKNKKEA